MCGFWWPGPIVIVRAASDKEEWYFFDKLLLYKDETFDDCNIFTHCFGYFSSRFGKLPQQSFWKDIWHHLADGISWTQFEQRHSKFAWWKHIFSSARSTCSDDCDYESKQQQQQQQQQMLEVVSLNDLLLFMECESVEHLLLLFFQCFALTIASPEPERTLRCLCMQPFFSVLLHFLPVGSSITYWRTLLIHRRIHRHIKKDPENTLLNFPNKWPNRGYIRQAFQIRACLLMYNHRTSKTICISPNWRNVGSSSYSVWHWNLCRLWWVLCCQRSLVVD